MNRLQPDIYDGDIFHAGGNLIGYEFGIGLHQKGDLLALGGKVVDIIGQ